MVPPTRRRWGRRAHRSGTVRRPDISATAPSGPAGRSDRGDGGAARARRVQRRDPVRAVVGCAHLARPGFTSTPVVDVAAATVWVVGEVTDGGRVHHRLAGLDPATGAIRASTDVDPPLRDGQRPEHLLQRASLALADGRVYAGFGGNIGDCG